MTARILRFTPKWKPRPSLLAWLHSLLAPILRWHFDRIAARARRAS